MFCCPPHQTPLEDEWRYRYLEQLQNFIVWEDRSSWGRLLCTWHEKRADGRIVTQTYAACIDSIEWGLYHDCPPRKIYVKCLTQFIARPFHAILKTLFHLSMVPLIYEIGKTWMGYQDKKTGLKNCIKSLSDIVLTPLFGLALCITSVAILAITPFAPKNLYKARLFLGKIEQMANWGQIRTAWTLARCFQPLPLSSLGTYLYKYNHDTAYPSEDPLEKQLANFARSAIRYKRREGFDFFDCQNFSKDTVYSSSILKELQLPLTPELMLT